MSHVRRWAMTLGCSAACFLGHDGTARSQAADSRDSAPGLARIADTPTPVHGSGSGCVQHCVPQAPSFDPAQTPGQAPPPSATAPGQTPTPPTPTTPPSATPPSATPPTPATPQTPATAPAPAFASATPQGALGGSDTIAANMMGDLLRAYRGVRFQYLGAGDTAILDEGGSVNFRNTKVADNNSAIPRDRVAFRYNYFHNAVDVQGIESTGVLGQRVQGVPGGPVAQFPGVRPGVETYDVHLYTMSLEKTLLDGNASVEVRVPWANSVDSDLNLEAGRLRDDFLIEPTPGQTLGTTDTELQDIQVITKILLYADADRRWNLSGGVGVTAPTAEDLNVRVVDFSGDVLGDPFDAAGNPLFRDLVVTDPFRRLFRQLNQFLFDQRIREFEVTNETWALSPFLAIAALPTERLFINGFVQIDAPLNSSEWRYRETDIDLEVQQGFATAANGPIQFQNEFSGEIDDQWLAHVDIGGGYWFYRNRQARLLTGLAGLLELHYTTTLEDADVVTVPAFRQRAIDDFGAIEPAPQIGNVGNRIDILNGTVGSYMLLGDSATLAAGYVFPLRDDFDKLFDGELNVQLNYYFGGPMRSPLVGPNF